MTDGMAKEQLASIVRRIEGVQDEIDALNTDKSEIYKEARGNGFDVKVLRKLIADRKKDANERAEFEAIYELYAASLGMIVASDDDDEPATSSLVRAHVENIEEFSADGGENEPQQLEPSPPAPEQAVEQTVVGNADPSSSPVESGAVEISTSIQPAVTWLGHGPERLRRHEYSEAFGTLGQDIIVIEQDIRNAASEPVVIFDGEILDGYARYMTAYRVGIEFPAVEYDGDDPLLDCIRWNVAGRILNDGQKRAIAQRLAGDNRKRKDAIYAAFELGMELVA